ncbi:MAG: metallophosphoesterase [Bacillota bacterium]
MEVKMLFALGDLHLSLDQEGQLLKPMDRFGERWHDHHLKIKDNWLRLVGEADVVAISGDISWAMRLTDALTDLGFIASLPGIKVFCEGNHDYWACSARKVRSILPPGVMYLDGDHCRVGEYVICAARGWSCPGDPFFDPETDLRIYERQAARLERALKKARTEVEDKGGHLVAMLHFPPTNYLHEPSAFTEALEHYQAEYCLYGHLHGQSQKGALAGMVRGVGYYLVAADYVGFRPVPIV